MHLSFWLKLYLFTIPAFFTIDMVPHLVYVARNFYKEAAPFAAHPRSTGPRLSSSTVSTLSAFSSLQSGLDWKPAYLARPARLAPCLAFSPMNW